MSLNESLITIGFGASALVIGGWVMIYYATMKHEEYQNIAKEQDDWVNQQVQKQIDKDIEELRNKPKNQTVKANFDDDVPF